MSGPIGGAVDPIGVAYADVRFRGDKAPKDVARILDDVSDDGNAEMDDIGDKWGDTLDKSLKSSTKNTGRDVARGISAGIEREGLKITRETIQFDSSGNIIKSWITKEVAKGERAVEELATTGFFKKIGSGISDAIGAGFNISGRSPLIPLLATLVGFIVEVIGSLVQAAGALVAVIALIPNLIFSVGLQVGVLMLAFHGLGAAIQGAFAATNAQELNEAIKNLTPSAQEFVRSLLPLKDLFNSLTQSAQEGFFVSFGDAITKMTDALGPQLSGNVSAIASSLGALFAHVLSFFGSPVFLRFLSEIVPSITKWLDNMGPALFSFLFGLTTFGAKLLPFLDKFGVVFTELLSDIGGWLNDLSNDPDFLDWLDRMLETFKLVGQIISDIGVLLVSFASALDKAGGNKLLEALSEQLRALAGFFSSDFGVKSLEGMIHAAILLSEIFIGLIVVVFAILGAFEIAGEFIKQLFTVWIPEWFNFSGEHIMKFLSSVGGFFSNLFTKQIPAFFEWLGTYIQEFLGGVINFIGVWVIRIVTAIGTGIGWIITKILEGTAAVAVWIHDRIMDIVDFARSIPGRITDAVGDLFGTLYNAGRNLIQGLINGITDKFGPLRDIASRAAQIFRNVWPFSPAKEGPLSGSGDPMIAGQKLVQRLAAGIEMESPTLTEVSNQAASSVLMGAGAVQMNFYGQPPTNAQASGIGSAAGNSFANVLAARNTRLAVRTQ